MKADDMSGHAMGHKGHAPGPAHTGHMQMIEDFKKRFVVCLILTVPIVGKLTRGFNTARFTRTFSILTASTVPVLEALRIAGEVVTNLPMRDAVADAAARVREGAPIGRSLAVSRLFPAEATYNVLNSTAQAPIRNTSFVQLPNAGTYISASVSISCAPLGCKSCRCSTVAPST